MTEGNFIVRGPTLLWRARQ